MDARKANIHFYEETPIKEQQLKEGLILLDDSDLKEMVNTGKRKRKNWMRNKPCICGSNKKFKFCCWSKYSY